MTLRLVGRVEMRNRLVPQPLVEVKIRRDISTAEVPLEKQGVSASNQAFQTRVPVQRREVPITSCYKNQWGLRRKLLEA